MTDTEAPEMTEAVEAPRTTGAVAVSDGADASSDGGSQAAFRRNLRLLAAAQLLSGVGITSGVTVGGVLMGRITHDVGLAGLAQTSTVLGAALFANPLARLAMGGGRHRALSVGFGLGTTGAVLILVACALGQPWLLFCGLFLFGSSTASGLQARYAATDLAPEGHHARAMSVVLWASTVGSVLGPNLSDLGNRLGGRLGLADLSGPYLFSVVVFATAAVLCRALADGRSAAASHDRPRPLGVRDAWRAVAADRRALLGLVSVVSGQTMMTTVMVMTPIHMNEVGIGLAAVGVVISTHILGMYALSPVVGWLADRRGAGVVVAVGLSLFVGAFMLGVFAAGDAAPRVLLGAALFLLGLAWSCTMIGGSSLLTSTLDRATRVATQGFTDSLMNLGSALAAAIAGPVLSLGGFVAINCWAAVFLLPLAWLLWGDRRVVAVRG